MFHTKEMKNNLKGIKKKLEKKFTTAPQHK